MKVLFVGLGSIGTRHLTNLDSLCKREGISLDVTALRSSERALPPELQAMIDREVDHLTPTEKFDIAFITLPTHLHATSIGLLKDIVDTFFIEKPLFDHTDYDLQALGLHPCQKAYIAAPLRWCAVYGALKKKLENFPVYSARAICSSYLPGWRPHTDYRDIYSARREMGGGVSLDLIHEWDYLTDLFGLPQKYFNLNGHFSDLEIDSDDLSVYIAKYPGFLCELHLDYFGRTYRRELEVFSKEGSMVANFGTGQLTLPDGTVEDYSEPVNRRYEREMAYFLNYAKSDTCESKNNPRHALHVLKIALGEDCHE